jgi:sugar/nucleoside kinase (ribokinase family)
MKYTNVVGTGGIGAGIFFQLQGMHTLGREESRLAVLKDFRDYCKMHIILHYVSRLTEQMNVIALGKVGQDEQGQRLIREMKDAGLTTDFVEQINEARTMLSICFQYPDGSGGNITTSNSACDFVTSSFIEAHANLIHAQSVILAAPEVPIDSRLKLLEIGRARGGLNVASVLSGEVDEFEQKNGYALCDVLAINLDEAKAISRAEGTAEEIARKTADKIVQYQANIQLIVTSGQLGCFTFEKGRCEKVGVIKIPLHSTAGAGDALLGGTIAGLVQGLPFQKGDHDRYFAETPLKSAVELGAIVSMFAVMSPHTIADQVSKANIKLFIKEHNLRISEEFANVI